MKKPACFLCFSGQFHLSIRLISLHARLLVICSCRLALQIFSYPQKLKDYRNNRRGVEAKSKKTEFTLFGALDDLWLNKDTDEIVVLDYKATSNKNDPDYVNSSQEYHKSYKRQLDFYAYLLKLNNYKIFKTGYWLICNATDENQKTFEGKLSFKITLLSYDLKTDYIEDILVELERCLKLEKPPSSGKYCSNCIWQNQVRPFKK